MAGQVINPDATPPEPSTAPPESSISPCERLWARYHSGPDGDLPVGCSRVAWDETGHHELVRGIVMHLNEHEAASSAVLEACSELSHWMSSPKAALRALALR